MQRCIVRCVRNNGRIYIFQNLKNYPLSFRLRPRKRLASFSSFPRLKIHISYRYEAARTRAREMIRARTHAKIFVSSIESYSSIIYT